MVDLHHIVCDGISSGILTDEFKKLYQGQTLGKAEHQYKDYSEWQNSDIGRKVMLNEEKYWMEKFSDELPILKLQTDYERPKIKSSKGDRIEVSIDKKLSSQIKDMARRTNTTVYMVLLAAYNIMLAKYTGQDDIIVGTVEAGRGYSELNSVVGMFINTIAHRNYPKDSKTVKEFLEDVKENTIKDFDNRDYQFDTLIDKLNINREVSRNPLFDTMFVLQNMSLEVDSDESYKPIEADFNIAKFDLTLIAKEVEDAINLDFEYCSELFKRKTVEMMGKHYINILKNMSSNYNKKLYEVDMISEEEKNIILYNFNDTKSKYHIERTIQALFEEQVQKTPEGIAVVCENQKLSYRELNEKANSLARYLIEQGVKQESLVGIMLDKSLYMVIGVIGILKAGAAYVPIDPSYPKQRKEYMIKDSNIKLLLTQEKYIQYGEYEVDTVDLEARKLYEYDKANLKLTSDLKALAYVIYTSGTTGRPKGVMVQNEALVNLCFWHNSYYEVDEKDNATKYAGFGFDASVWEIFPYILKGATLYMIPEDIKLDIEKLNEFYNKNNITISFLPTQICEQFMKLKNNSLRILLTGADKLKNYEKQSYKLVNNYGPTENAVVTTSFIVDKKYNNIPIGKPIANCKIFIVQNNSTLVPVGVPGELCIGGRSLALGYLNRDDLTAEKFVDNPFEKNMKMYKTGDLARWLPDGNIEYIGRIDNQVKIRGFRIELGEIENTINKNPKIGECVVVTEDNKLGDKEIVAYYTAIEEVSSYELKANLASELPNYMIPQYFVQVDVIPTTNNGKIDFKELSNMKKNYANFEVNHVEEATDTENNIRKIWSRVLGTEQISITDNFFDIGGNSIKVVNVYNELKKIYGSIVNVTDIFVYPTIYTLAQFIDNASVEEEVAVTERFIGKSIAFPKDYILEEEERMPSKTLRFVINSTFYERMIGVCEANKFNIDHLLLGAYTFLISQISNSTEVIVHTQLDEGNIITELNIDIYNINNFYDIVSLVNSSIENADVSRKYYIGSFINMEDSETGVIPFFSTNVDYIYSDEYDLALKVGKNKNEITVECFYNTKRLKGVKIEEFVKIYINLLNKLT
jgi:amino acid adenylation domain-containing protein